MGIENIEILTNPTKGAAMPETPEEEKAKVTERPENYDQQVKDAQVAAENEARDEHNRRARESAGQDERISDETAERHKPSQ